MKSIKTCKDLKGKTVIVRVDYNVPLEGNRIRDAFRIDVSLPTIELLRKKGAKVILVSHIGKDGTQSLAPVAKYLSKKISLIFVPTADISKIKTLVATMKNKDVMLIENIRTLSAEKNNDPTIAKEFASIADVYVNDAFPVSHRADMSIVGFTKYLPSFSGLQFEKEITELSRAVSPQPARPSRSGGYPFLFVLGGAKFETKMPLIKKFLKSADHVLIGGALLNNFLKEQGFEIGKSLIDEACPPLASLIKNPKLLIPTFVVVMRGTSMVEVSVADVKKNDVIVDVGVRSIKEFSHIISDAKLVVWNGPLGLYEKGATKATMMLLKNISNSKAKAIIGGGDTATLAHKKNASLPNMFISTGGGATIEFLSKGTLVGIKALK